MHKRARIAIPIVLVAALLAGGYYWWNQRATAVAQSGVLTGSGTIEAEQVLITSEVAGRVQQLMVDEGQEVTAGQTLAQLDTALMEAQLAQAKAAVGVAEANLAQLQSGSRPEEVAQAQAAVAQAQAAYDGASAAHENAVTMLNNPQELNAQVVQAQAGRDAARAALAKVKAGTRPEDLAAAQSQLEQARTNVQATRDRLSAAKTQAESQVQQSVQALTQAQARYAQAKSNWDFVQETGKDPIMPNATNPQTGKKSDNNLSDGARENYYAQFVQAEAALRSAEQAVQQAQLAADTAHQSEITGVQTAEEQVRTVEAQLAKLQAGATREDVAAAQTALASAQRVLDVMASSRAEPQQLQALADNSAAQQQQAQAQVDQAKARLELAKNGARAEQIQMAEAQVAQAKAAQQQVAVQLGKTTLTAPRDGLVLSRPIHEGEQAAPGTTLMTIGSLDTVKLTLYIGETDIGHVRVGQKVNVTVDSFPSRTFTGTVTFIAQDAQFTPRNVQTKDERATTVFAVRVELPNADHALKPGMPADAVIVEATRN